MKGIIAAYVLNNIMPILLVVGALLALELLRRVILIAHVKFEEGKARAAAIKNDVLRTTLTWLIVAAEKMVDAFGAKLSGPEKKQWVLDQAERFFPNSNPDLIASGVEAVLAQIHNYSPDALLPKDGVIAGKKGDVTVIAGDVVVPPLISPSP